MIQQKLTKTKTKMILITKTLVIFRLYTSRHLCWPADRALDVQDIGYSLPFQVIITITITIVSLLVLGKYVSKVSITVHEQKTPYSVDGKPSWSELESGFQLGSNLGSQYHGSDVLTYHYTNILESWLTPLDWTMCVDFDINNCLWLHRKMRPFSTDVTVT